MLAVTFTLEKKIML